MKTTRITITMLIFLFLGISTQAQFLDRLANRAEKAAERAVIRKTEQKVQKETEKAMDTILSGGKKADRKKRGNGRNEEVVFKETSGSDDGPREDSGVQGVDTAPGSSSQEDSDTATVTPKTWSKYNFVPGDEIIFEDDLVSEENGEFPSRWDLSAGSAENAKMGEENIINFENYSIITPLMDEASYLPEIFTVEFDAYFNDGPASWQSYQLRFWQGTQYLSEGKDVFWPVKIFKDGATTHTKIQDNDKKYDAHDETVGESSGWKHIAIAFNKRSLKVFVDEYRALNIPNYGYEPKMLSIGAEQYDPEGKIMAIKNIRIAKGGKKLYDRVMADGKFVTRGILFDIGKATLKPSSIGVINGIAKMMQEHSNLKFSIEGHTDSDGDETHNLELSQARAATVKKALIDFGIDSARLETKGLGEKVPVSDNATPEGKANNRRVEFVKI